MASSDNELSKYHCGKCIVPDHDKMVQCDLCDKWYHFECVDVGEEIADISWQCDTCVETRPHVVKTTNTNGNPPTTASEDTGPISPLTSVSTPIQDANAAKYNALTTSTPHNSIVFPHKRDEIYTKSIHKNHLYGDQQHVASMCIANSNMHGHTQCTHINSAVRENNQCTHINSAVRENNQCTHINSAVRENNQCTHINSAVRENNQCTHTNSAVRENNQCRHTNSAMRESNQCTHTNSSVHDNQQRMHHSNMHNNNIKYSQYTHANDTVRENQCKCTNNSLPENKQRMYANGCIHATSNMHQQQHVNSSEYANQQYTLISDDVPNNHQHVSASGNDGNQHANVYRHGQGHQHTNNYANNVAITFNS